VNEFGDAVCRTTQHQRPFCSSCYEKSCSHSLSRILFKCEEPQRVATEREVLEDVAKVGQFEEQRQAAANVGPHNHPIEMGLDDLVSTLPQVQCIVETCVIKVQRTWCLIPASYFVKISIAVPCDFERMLTVGSTTFGKILILLP